MNLRQRGLMLVAALTVMGACGVLTAVSGSTALASSQTPTKHHPSPSPKPTPSSTPRPTPTPTPRPTATPPPTQPPTAPPTPVPTAAPTAPAAPAPSAAPSIAATQPAKSNADQGTGGLPYTGLPPADGSAQAVVLSPTSAADATNLAASQASDESLVWLMLLTFVAIPVLIVMTLISTVLIRR